MISAPTTTFWRSFEVSARQKWTFADSFGVEVGAGYVRDQFEFNGMASDVAQVPDTDYKAIRIGGKFSMLLGSVEPYVAAENRIVLNGGDLADRLRSSTTSGLHGALGIVRVDGLAVRAPRRLAHAIQLDVQARYERCGSGDRGERRDLERRPDARLRVLSYSLRYFSNALKSYGRPRKSLTRSAASLVPPGDEDLVAILVGHVGRHQAAPCRTA